METNLKETCKSLKELSQSLKIQEECNLFLSQSEEEYVENNVDMEKPELKTIVQLNKPIKQNSKSNIVLQVIGLISPVILSFIFAFASGGSSIVTMFGLLIGIFILSGCFVKVGEKEKYYQKMVDHYEKMVKENEENKKYNEKYPELLKEYNRLVEACKTTYYEQYPGYTQKLEDAKNIISKHEGIISPKFYDDIDDIVELLEYGRADSLKEAINTLISERRQEEMVRIAEQQRIDAQRHNMEMQAQARRQADAAEKGAEAAERSAETAKKEYNARMNSGPNCATCRNWPCGGNPAFCGSYVKK